MAAYLEHFITYSTVYSLIAIVLIAFLESLAVIGLMLPGTVMMASLGALIGSGKVGFFPAWGAGIVGCLLGDWISYMIGYFFKAPLHQWSFLQRYKELLNKTEYALQQHSMLTILLGRLIGPTRPVVPMVAGMLNLSPYKFAFPNMIGCIIWPPIYFFPGILAGIAVHIPTGQHGTMFNWLLLGCFIFIWLAAFFLWGWYRYPMANKSSARWLTRRQLGYLSVITLVSSILFCVVLFHHPLFPIYWQLLLTVFKL